MVYLVHHVNYLYLRTLYAPPDVELNQLVEIIRELDPLFREYIIQQIKLFASLHKKSKEKAPLELPGLCGFPQGDLEKFDHTGTFYCQSKGISKNVPHFPDAVSQSV